MNFKNIKPPKVPVRGIASLLAVGIVSGLGVYGLNNGLYNVEGGSQAIVFNHITGLKDKRKDSLRFRKMWIICLERPKMCAYLKCLVISSVSKIYSVQKHCSTPQMLVYPEGTHLIIPWFERPIIYDVRARPHEVDSTTGSRDLQMVLIGLRVLARPVPDQLPTIYRTLGVDYMDRVMPSIIHETLKAVIAQYNASQLITQREAVSREIRKILTERAAKFNIAMNDVSITKLTFGKEFTSAIEAKQVAAQDAERAKYVVEKAEQDKNSAIIRAQGEAASAKLIGEAIAKNPAFVTLRKIEAARDIAHKIANSANRVYLDSDSLLLNLQSLNLEVK